MLKMNIFIEYKLNLHYCSANKLEYKNYTTFNLNYNLNKKYIVLFCFPSYILEILLYMKN